MITLKANKSTPGINSGSLKIINTKLKDKKPIYKRFEEIKNEKKAKLEKYKKDLIRNNSAKNLSSGNYGVEFKSINDKKQNKTKKTNFNYNTKNNNLINNNNQNEKECYTKQNFDEWLHNNELWRGQKERKSNALKQKMEERKQEIENSANTHNPKIDQLSDLIANTKNFNEFPGLEVHEKLYSQKDNKIHKQKILELKTKPRFAPIINNYTPRYFSTTTGKNSTKAAENKLYINEVFGAKFDLGSNLLKETMTQTRKSQENEKNGFFYWCSNKPLVNEDYAAYGNPSSTSSRRKFSSGFKFMFDLNDKKMKSFSQMKIDPKTGLRLKSDLTFFEQGADNKLIFYN